MSSLSAGDTVAVPVADTDTDPAAAPQSGPAARLQALLLDHRALSYALVLFGALAWIATVLLTLRALRPMGAGLEAVIALATLGAYGALLASLRRWSAPLAARLVSLAGGRSLLFALVLGLLLRLAWVLIFPGAPSSDGQTYLTLAGQLAAGQPYFIGGTQAYWPPGYALFLAPFVLLLPATLAVPLTQIGLSVLAIIGVYRLTRQLAGATAAGLAACLFAVWPNLVAHAATPEKEMLVMTLLVWLFVFLVRGSALSLLGAGLMLGAATLVQPSVQLLIPALVLLLLLRLARARWPLIVLFVLGCALAIAPWTIRNYQSFGQFKMVSTNGGDNLYRANNPLATGGYVEHGEQDFSALSELERDRVAKASAFAWMRSHPAAFLALGVEKQLRFMGDDAGGVYSTFRGDGAQRSDRVYLPLKMAANAWWLLAWFAMALLILGGARLGKASFLVWGWIYLFALHSIFESAGKYHVPMLWVLCVLSGVLIAALARRAGVEGKDG